MLPTEFDKNTFDRFTYDIFVERMVSVKLITKWPLVRLRTPAMAFGASVSGVSWTAMSASAFWFCPISSNAPASNLLTNPVPSPPLVPDCKIPDTRSVSDKVIESCKLSFSLTRSYSRLSGAVASSLLFIILIFGSEIWEAGVASIVSDKYITTAPSLKSTVIFIIFGDSTSPYSVKFWDTTSTFKFCPISNTAP